MTRWPITDGTITLTDTVNTVSPERKPLAKAGAARSPVEPSALDEERALDVEFERLCAWAALRRSRYLARDKGAA